MKIEKWTASGASCRGRSHIAKGLPCQDYFATSNDRWPKVVVLADGAGSAKCAEVGAKLAVAATRSVLESFVKTVDECEEEDLCEKIMNEILDSLKFQAKKDGNLIQDYASTLLFAATDGISVLAGNLGDGVILMQMMSGQVQPLLKPQRGEYASSTYMTTSENALTVFELKKIQANKISGLALLTDGASGVMYNSRQEKAAPAVGKIIDWFEEDQPMEPKLEQTIQSLIIEKTRDDCSIGVLKKRDVTPALNGSIKSFLYALSIYPRHKTHAKNRLAAIKVAMGKKRAGSVMSKSSLSRHLKWIQNNLFFIK